MWLVNQDAYTYIVQCGLQVCQCFLSSRSQVHSGSSSCAIVGFKCSVLLHCFLLCCLKGAVCNEGNSVRPQPICKQLPGLNLCKTVRQLNFRRYPSQLLSQVLHVSSQSYIGFGFCHLRNFGLDGIMQCLCINDGGAGKEMV